MRVGTPTADSLGFYYGTDSNLPTANINSFPYLEPGTTSDYGFYAGDIGSYWHFAQCTSSPHYGLNLNPTNIEAADANDLYDGIGLGADPIWFMAGPGTDPLYGTGPNGGLNEAALFGGVQASRVVYDLSTSIYTYSGYTIWMDIEDAVNTGWDAVWSGHCGPPTGHEIASSVPSSFDFETLAGFIDIILSDTPFLPGVYEAGGGGGNSWSGIFGSYSIANSATAEWTYVNETSSLATFPQGWTIPGSVSASFFSGVSQGSPQAAAWQWSGGDGVLNGIGDYDQAELGQF